jgi:hypothetical protein
MRPFRLLSALLTGALLAAVLVSPAQATISGASATPGDADLIFQVESPLETSAKLTQTYSSDGSVTYTPSTENFANPERGSGTYPATAVHGGSLPVSFTVHNDGYATPYTPRNLELVLRNTSTGSTYKLAMSSDPSRWTAGTSTTVSQTLTLPTTLPAGQYSLLPNLPDPLLSTRPEYSIRLANQGTWDATTGMNSLLHTLTVS